MSSEVMPALRSELKDTLKLAAPIVISQVGHMSMGLVDTLVAGHITTEVLAGLGLAANLFWTFTSVCMGCLLALDTFFSQSVGAGNDKELARYLGQSWWACAVVTGVAAVCIFGGYWAYRLAVPLSPTRVAFTEYVEVIVLCLPSLFVFFVLQRYWQARRRVVAFTLIILSANIVNLLACLGLGLGWWGAPRLEARGIAWATVISRYAMLAAALVFTWYHLRPPRIRLPVVDASAQYGLFKLGLPAAGHTALEVGAFAIATFVVGALGPVQLAAHHVCLTMAAFTFMFPLGFSSAAAVRVGTFIGAGEPHRARLAGFVCIGLSVSVMGCFAVGYLVFPGTLLAWFTRDPAVIDIGVKLLLLVALFQLADGIQVCTTGALRGLGNTRAAMYANLVGHYPIGLVCGLVLCFGFGMKAVGVWTGLALGLITVAVVLLTTWFRLTRNLDALHPSVSGPKT